DDKPFAHFRTQALPRLHAARPPGTPLRIWSAAASSGQEAYSLAMILADLRPLGRFDIVFCRNVLIYFDQPTKARALEAIAALMPPDGLLYLGGAETVLGITSRLAPVAGARGVYGLASAAALVT